MLRIFFSYTIFFGLQTLVADTGLYSQPSGNPENTFDAPVPGFVGPDGDGNTGLSSSSNYLNPLFFDWASFVVDYSPFGTVGSAFADSTKALGPVTGDPFDVAALGDMDQTSIDAWLASPGTVPGPGSLTVSFDAPILNKSGSDFVLFENGFTDASGNLFAEFAYVEVSANGTDFFRFQSDANTPSSVASYEHVDVTQVTNLAGKHANGYGVSWGTPFDLSDVGLASISYIRVVDIPGSGDFTDSSGDPIHDSWFTFGSGGADMEAFGAISTEMVYADWPQLAELDPEDRDPEDDPDADGVPNLMEYAFATVPWLADEEEASVTMTLEKTQGSWNPRIHFVRDERLSDIRMEVQVAESLTPPVGWTTLVISDSGGALVAQPSATVVINETSNSDIASVGVIRAVTVTDLSTSTGPRFYRIRVTEVP